MSDLVTEDDLARARGDADFRQLMLKANLERLLAALNRMRGISKPSPDSARQLREGVDLAVQLADRLQQNSREGGPKAA